MNSRIRVAGSAIYADNLCGCYWKPIVITIILQNTDNTEITKTYSLLPQMPWSDALPSDNFNQLTTLFDLNWLLWVFGRAENFIRQGWAKDMSCTLANYQMWTILQTLPSRFRLRLQQCDWRDQMKWLQQGIASSLDRSTILVNFSPTKQDIHAETELL
jgi:hypothetical protein